MMDPDLRELLLACLGPDAPDPGRGQALLTRLTDDPAFRLAFVDELRMIGMVRTVQTGEPKWLRLADALNGPPGPRVGDEQLAEVVVRTAKAHSRRRRAFRLISVAAGIAILAVLAVILTRTPRAHRGDSTPPRDEVARVTESESVVWAGGDRGQPSVGHPVFEGSYRLSTGRLTLAYPSGVFFCVEGPADFDLVSHNLVRYRTGNIRVRVPGGAEGFTVRADGFEVVDLGTEFAMKSTATGKAQLMVFEGEAAVSVFGTGTRSVQSVIVESAQVVDVDPESRTIRNGRASPDTFVRPPVRTTVDEPPLALASEYREAVLAAKPWSYWRFERRSRGVVANELPDRPPLRMAGRVMLDGPPHRNRHVVFDWGDVSQALAMDGHWTPPRTGGYAVEFWVLASADRPPNYGKTALVSLIAERPEKPESHVSLVELTARSREPSEPCAVRFLDRWPAALSGGSNAVSRRFFQSGKWHHVVAQKLPDSVELFIDGELVASNPVAPEADPDAPPSGPCRLLIGRLKTVGVDPDNIRSFVGRMDELAIYDHPLTEGEIRSHFRLRQ